MAQIINTNVASLNAQRNLNTSQSALSVSLQRLSSGLRINSAKDDAAGLAISDRFTTQIRGLNQASRNASDGISLSQTSESALAEIGNNLQRIRELAVQSANATNSTSDRAALDLEVQQRISEIDRIASQTSFNGRKVLDGTFGTAAFQVGANVGETITVGLSASSRTDAIGKTADYVGGVAYSSALSVGQQGTGVNATAITASTQVTLAVGTATAIAVANTAAGPAGAAAGQTSDSAYAKVAAINASGISGLTATADTTAVFGFSTVVATAYSLTINGAAIVTATDYSVTNLTGGGLVSLINTNSSASGVTASYDGTNITLQAADGRDIIITEVDTGGGTGGLEATDDTLNNSVNDALTLTGAAPAQVIAKGSIRLTGSAQIVVGGTAPAQLGFATSTLALGNSALNNASVTTVANANTAINRVDAALTSVSNLRSTFGAIQNRFESVIANLDAVAENLTASRSRILDADFGAETAALTRGQILQQAGVAILAQANALPNNVLALLRG
jgi:flagellin